MNDASLEGEMVVWCLLRDQYAHVRPVEAAMAGKARFVYDADWVPEKVVRARPDVVVCVNDLHFDVMRCLDAVRAAGIPSLVVQDGILEWRCQYENPRLGAGGGPPQHQPVLADKIACIGHQSARQIAAWGNAHKVEVTGMPRLDAIATRRWPSPRRPGRRLLVMTAKKPGFTEEQTQVTLRSLRDVAAWAAEHRETEVVWRITKGLHAELGVENQLSQVDSMELAEVLAEVDAVVTTLSTAILEAWLLGRPVAALDYHNVPRFVPTAWTISAREHIDPVVGELMNPPPVKMQFQTECLHDCLLVGKPAAIRVAELVQKMCSSTRSVVGRMSLPTAALQHPGSFLNPSPLPLEELYPDCELFKVGEVTELQARLARANLELAELKRLLEARRGGYWLNRFGRLLWRLGRRTSRRERV